jgi:hypothetical protein
VGGPDSPALGAALASVGQVGGIAEANAASFGGRQGGLSPLADHLALVLRHRGQDVHRQPVRGREVAGHEVGLGLHQGADEVHVAAESIQLGDHQGAAVKPAGGQSLR